MSTVKVGGEVPRLMTTRKLRAEHEKLGVWRPFSVDNPASMFAIDRRIRPRIQQRSIPATNLNPALRILRTVFPARRDNARLQFTVGGGVALPRLPRGGHNKEEKTQRDHSLEHNHIRPYGLSLQGIKVSNVSAVSGQKVSFRHEASGLSVRLAISTTSQCRKRSRRGLGMAISGRLSPARLPRTRSAGPPHRGLGWRGLFPHRPSATSSAQWLRARRGWS